MELFYYHNQKRLGPVNSAQIRALAARGEITPETIVEAGGKSFPAAKIRGLEFPAPVPPAVPADPEPPAAGYIVSPYGGAIPRNSAEPAPAADQPHELKVSAAALEKSVKNIRQIGWVIVGGWVVEFLICLVAAMNSKDPGPFIVGGLLSAVPAGVAASVFFFLGNLGRFLLAWTRFHNDN